jgi:peptidoglycan/xylan/chitin deacetylase (PgdA/CDA1 family)
MYHDIAKRSTREDVGFPGQLAARYKLEPDAFAAHLEALADTGYTVGTLVTDATATTQQPQVVVSFDDGGRSALQAAEALEHHGWRGQFFVTTARIGTHGFLDGEEIRALAQRGHVIGSHSHTHPTYMGRLSRAELDREWRTSRELLGETLGAAPRSASVPGGYLSPPVVDAAAAAGYELLFTSEPTSRVKYGAITVRGRFTIWASTPASVAAAYARGDRAACGKLWLEWNAKKLAKRASPRVYQGLRHLRASRV